MCGLIAGIGPNAQGAVASAFRRVNHRGIREKIAFGLEWAISHTRLPINGLDECYDMPVHRGNWSVAFVGEVFDFRNGRRGNTYQSDVYFVADTWAEEGPSAFCRFDGFWHIVAYDHSMSRLHVLSDYLAQKPLYYRQDGTAIIGSEPDAVASIAPVHFDEVYFSAISKWGYCPETWRTPYREVTRAVPGSYLIFDQSGLCIHNEVRDQVEPIPMTLGDLREAIEEATRLRAQLSDVPIACLVSGGLDSSIVYSLARKYAEVHPYHVENNEWEDCERVAPNATRLDPNRVTVAQALDYHQEPIDLGSLIPQVALSDAIRESGDERVCLTGDGADELFGGYGRALRYDSQLSDIWHELVAWHLPRLDRVMMRNLIEVRSPFLARRVLAGALALPRRERIQKRVLRHIFRDLLPSKTLTLEKKPLRTKVVERSRESWTRELIRVFRKTRSGFTD